MITDYSISCNKNEVTLIVNLDFNYEFAVFNSKNITRNLKNEIYNLANKINANKVKILVNGILITTLFLPISSSSENYNNITFITSNTIEEKLISSIDDILPENIVDSIKNESDNLVIKKEEELPINTKVNEAEKKEEKIPNVSNIQKDNEVPKIEEFNFQNNNSKLNDNQVKEEKHVTVYRSNGTILELQLEEYLIGVVGSEMPASFNSEALKAQAVVARTYALKCISENKILTDNTNTQVYKDNNELKEMWKNDFDKYYEKVKNAVLSTKGVVLTYNNKYIDAVYHSTSNGYTEDSVYVWGYSIPYLKQVESKTDINVSSYKREKVFTFDELGKLINTTIDENTEFILERNNSNRVINVKVNDIEIKGTTFRSLLGLRSTDFTIELKDENILITTYGYGHGVGMSQYGANGMANNGYTYKDILLHYYKDVKIEKE